MSLALRRMLVLVVLVGTGPAASAQIRAQARLGVESFGPELTGRAELGQSLAALGDLDGNGVPDFAVGAPRDDGPGPAGGSVWVLLLDADGGLANSVELSVGPSDDGDLFGSALAPLGDLDGDGVIDLVVGAAGEGPNQEGAVYVLFLSADGSLASFERITQGVGGFTGSLALQDFFGTSVAAVGDLDGDGVVDLAVGAEGDNDGGAGILGKGAVWILFLNSDGTVRGHQKISATQGGFTGTLNTSARFGSAVAPLGDLDGDGVLDLAVGAVWDVDGSTFSPVGAVWILFMNPDGTVRRHQKISATQGGLRGPIDDADEFGSGLAPLGDHDGDGVTDLAVGSRGDEDGSVFIGGDGAVWILLLAPDGTVRDEYKLSQTRGGLGSVLGTNYHFGADVELLGDLDGDGLPELGVGAPGDYSQHPRLGAVWRLYLCAPTASASTARNGSGVNPTGFVELTPPTLGTVWETSVDVSAPGVLASAVACSATGPLQVPTLLGELLVDPTSGLAAPIDVAFGRHAIALPPSCACLGRPLWAQAATFSTTGVTLQNALDLVLGTY